MIHRRLIGLMMLIPAALVAASPLQAADMATLQQLYDGTMLPDVAVETLSHTERLLPVRVVHRGRKARVLTKRTTPFPPIHFMYEGRSLDLYDYLTTNRVAGLLILKNGEIALEHYQLGTGPQTHWASFSMAKSVASTLAGVALADGAIAGLDDPVARYVPALRGGAYEGVSIRQLLNMRSGVCWNETYTDPTSDRRKVLELQITGQAGAVLRYMNSLARCGAAGSSWNYNTGETYVLGAVIEGATRKPLTQFLSEAIWSRAGMEQDATWWVEQHQGMTWAGTGLGATLRDYGRFGLLVADGGRLDGRSIVPEGWFSEAGAPHSVASKTLGYGYMWWIPDQSDPMHVGAFEAVGIFGQYLYVNSREHLVIVVQSARSKPNRTACCDIDDNAFFSAVASALH